MIEFIEDDSQITVSEIEQFIKNNDPKKNFSIHSNWYKNFIEHFKQIIETKQVATFRENNILKGLVTWAVVDEYRKQQINKSRWLLPKNISEGDILYIDTCLLKEGTNIFKIKSFFEKKYKQTVKKVFWFDMPHRRVFLFKNWRELCKN